MCAKCVSFCYLTWLYTAQCSCNCRSCFVAFFLKRSQLYLSYLLLSWRGCRQISQRPPTRAVLCDTKAWCVGALINAEAHYVSKIYPALIRSSDQSASIGYLIVFFGRENSIKTWVGKTRKSRKHSNRPSSTAVVHALSSRLLWRMHQSFFFHFPLHTVKKATMLTCP